MTVLASSYGLIVRRTERTKNFLDQRFAMIREELGNPERLRAREERMRARGIDLPAGCIDDYCQQDEDLVSFHSRHNTWRGKDVDLLLACGAQEGVDFVVPQHGGRIDDCPDWLIEEREQPLNPPEVIARMSPEVEAMWDERRGWLYSVRR